jgi:hypothetical protein
VTIAEAVTVRQTRRIRLISASPRFKQDPDLFQATKFDLKRVPGQLFVRDWMVLLTICGSRQTRGHQEG